MRLTKQRQSSFFIYSIVVLKPILNLFLLASSIKIIIKLFHRLSPPVTTWRIRGLVLSINCHCCISHLLGFDNSSYIRTDFSSEKASRSLVPAPTAPIAPALRGQPKIQYPFTSTGSFAARLYTSASSYISTFHKFVSRLQLAAITLELFSTRDITNRF